jgi:RNA polymerase sigma-70 factor (ECF subfamily)
LNTGFDIDEFVDLIPSLRAYARVLAKSATYADDLVQDTLERAWRNRELFHTDSNLRSWLFRILRNRFTDEFRRHRNVVQDVNGAYAAYLVSPAEQYWRLQSLDLIDAINKMSPDVRDALLLVIGLGFTHDEAAAVLDCPLGTLKSRVRRARVQLSDLVEAPNQPSGALALPGMGRKM